MTKKKAVIIGITAFILGAVIGVCVGLGIYTVKSKNEGSAVPDPGYGCNSMIDLSSVQLPFAASVA